MSEKILGYLFLTAGILLMGFAAFSVYSVFTGQAVPFMLFNFKGVSIPLATLMGAEMPQNVTLPEMEIFPAEVLNSTSNTLAHLFLMGFIVSVGYKVASLGVNLLRPIVVRMEKKIPVTALPIEK